MSAREPESPIAFRVSVARLPRKGMPVEIEADARQRAALAAEHGLLDVERFNAEMLVSEWKRGGVRVAGRVAADIVQSCIVTLEPLSQHVDAPFEAVFVPQGSALVVPERQVEGEILIDAEGPDAPEIFTGDAIDVGQLAEEHFALALDPYPRKAGARLPAASAGGVEDKGPLFEGLAVLKDRLKKS